MNKDKCPECGSCLEFDWLSAKCPKCGYKNFYGAEG
jgi:rRNA maturation protein Nop10